MSLIDNDTKEWSFMMKKLGVMVIGCGAISKNHGESVLNNSNAEIVCCVDLKKEKAQEFSEKYSGIPLTDYRELIESPDIDVVHLCTPHFTHAPLAIEMLNRGKHVFCEKPMAINPKDAHRMVEAAEKNKRYLGVCFQNRLNSSTIMAKNLIDEKKYGDILSAIARVAWDRHGKYYTDSDWRGRYETEGGGCIINQSIHTIDLLDYLCGGIASITAIATKFRHTNDYEVDDSCMANFNLHNGKTAVGYFTNCYAYGKISEIEIVFEEANLILDQKSCCIKKGNKINRFECKAAEGEKSEWGLSHGKLIDEFYSCILEKRPFFIDGKSAVKAVKIVEAIKKSNGKLVHIKD